METYVRILELQRNIMRTKKNKFEEEVSDAMLIIKNQHKDMSQFIEGANFIMSYAIPALEENIKDIEKTIKQIKKY